MTCEHHHFRVNSMFAALGVEILYARDAALGVIVVHAMNERLADDACPEPLGLREIGVGGGRLRSGWAT